MQTLKSTSGKAGKARDIRRIMAFLLLAVTFFAYLVPITLPITITAPTRDYYNTINALPPKSLVIIAIGHQAADMPTHGPGETALVKLMVRKSLRFVVLGTEPSAAPVAEMIFTLSKIDSLGYVYGKDYASLGYLPGSETAIARLATDIPGTIQTDVRQKLPVSQLPVMQGILTAKDVGAVALFTGTGDATYWMRHWVQPYSTKLVVEWIGGAVPQYSPFYLSGQVKGYLNDMSGCAELETLVGVPGDATVGLNFQSLGQLTIIAAMVLGNILFFTQKMRGGK